VTNVTAAGSKFEYAALFECGPTHHSTVTPMRTFIRLASCAVMLSLLAAPSGAQILGRLQKRAQEAVEKKAEDKLNAKIDELAKKMVDNSFSAVFGDSTAPGASGAAAGSGGGGAAFPFSIGSNAKTEDRYAFDVVSTMEIEAFRKDGRSGGKSIMRMHFNPNEAYTGTSIESADGKKMEGSTFIVLDAKNQAMVMMMASDKQKFSIAYDWKEAQKYAQSKADPVNWDTVTVWKTYKKIGTKTIAGYSAEGYRADGAEGTAELWVSRDRRLGSGSMFAASGSMKQFKGRMPADMPQGMLLEMTSTNASSGEKVTMRVTDVKTNANVVYAMSDYPKMEMGAKK
jgi:hypothetical protein